MDPDNVSSEHGTEQDRLRHQLAPYRIFQVAVDYSPIIIDKSIERHGQCKCIPRMRSGSKLLDEEIGSCETGDLRTAWVEADVRDLEAVRDVYGDFDVVIDKGTMDALQAGILSRDLNL